MKAGVGLISNAVRGAGEQRDIHTLRHFLQTKQ